MILRALGIEIDPSTKLHVRKPPPRTCGTRRSREARKGVEEHIIDDTQKAIKQPSGSRYENPLLKGRQ
jgi:hypothetical protein